MTRNKKAQQIAKTLLTFLKASRQEHMLPEVVKELDAYAQRRSTANRAIIHTASTLSKDDAEALARFLESQVNHKVSVETHLDPSLIAGFTIRFQDKMYDYSVKHKLETIEDELAKAS